LKATKWVALAAALALSVAAVGCTGGTAEKTSTDAAAELTGSINVEGSDTMVNLAQAWAESFQGTNPGVMIAVKGGGSGTGIAALINGTVDFADASRQMKEEEISQAQANGVTPTEIEVAKDGIAVVVNPANGVVDLTLDQLGRIYRGEVTNWKDVGGKDAQIVLLSRDSSSGTYEYFKEEVVGKDKEYAKTAKLLASTQAIIDETKNNPNAIGYVGLGYVTADVKVVAVDGVAASAESALDGSYALSRGLYLYSNGEPTGVMKAYVDYILSAEGQKVVTDQGFVPVTK